MLEGLRVASVIGLAARPWPSALGVIVVSFAIWGVGDVFAVMTAATSGACWRGRDHSHDGSTLTAYGYQRRIEQKLRRAVTNREARQAGLDQQVLATSWC